MHHADLLRNHLALLGAAPSRQDRMSFEEFVDATDRATSIAQLFEILILTMAAFGYDQLNFSLMRVCGLADAFVGLNLINTYQLSWQLHYAERGFAKIDPVLKHALGSEGPFRWIDLGRQTKLTPKETAFMRLGQEEGGLFNGVGLPFKGPASQVGGIAMATSVRRPGALPSLNALVGYVEQFFTAYKRLAGQSPALKPSIGRLSVREFDVLILLAEDYSDDQIAVALGMALNTVKTHVKHILQKLGVASRGAAVAVGIRYGLIE